MTVLLRGVLAALETLPGYIFTERESLAHVAEPFERVKAASPADRLAFVFDALEAVPNSNGYHFHMAVKGMVSALLRSGLPLDAEAALQLVECVTRSRAVYPYKAILSAVKDQPMTPELRAALRRLRPMITEWHGGSDMKDIHARIDALVHGEPEITVKIEGPWSRQVFNDLLGSQKKAEWFALLLHARTLTQSNPSKKWLSEAAAITGRIGCPELGVFAERWLARGPMPGSSQVQTPEPEADYQKGLVWALAAAGDVSLAPAIADFACGCFRKIPQIGAVSHRVGNACVNALAAMPGLDAVAQISRLATRVKYDVARRLIEKALAEAAVRNNVSRDELEAMSVPSFGLDANGVRVEALGGCQARLSIENLAAALGWSSGGMAVKSVPAEAREQHAAAVAELKKSAKELDVVLSTLRLRLERQLLTQVEMPYERWRGLYLDHPVTSAIARKMIWEIDGRTAIYADGALADWAGNPVNGGQTVRLWHPIRASVQEVLSWRCWLEDHGVRQPFKQAHREVYLLTDAERQTATYSNRFAAHIVKQHQFSALCRERGWQFTLMGQWDSHNTPTLELPQFDLRVEFHVEAADDREISGHAIYLAIRTDRVLFFSHGQLMNLADVPAIVFSEVLRDVDLFVGVTSIGNDPAWGMERHIDYWQRFAFGDLSEAAENRRGIVEALLPKLAIRDRCRVEGKFLVVRGKLHEYRIHLGSSNILMDGSRYLCIVHGPGDSAAQLPLPFDGDRVLALILSKALLLVKDDAIKEESIRSQIRA